MTLQRFVITKYSKNSYPNTFKQINTKHSSAYRVVRLKGNSDELIGTYFTQMNAVNAARKKANSMKNTTKVEIVMHEQNKPRRYI